MNLPKVILEQREPLQTKKSDKKTPWAEGFRVVAVKGGPGTGYLYDPGFVVELLEHDTMGGERWILADGDFDLEAVCEIEHLLKLKLLEVL